MAFLFTHLVLSWIPAKLFEKIQHTRLTRTHWALLFIGTLLPDTDFLIDWTFGTQLHRTFTHSLLAVLTGFIILTLLARYRTKNYRDAATFGFALAFGILMHLCIDLFGYQGVPLLWPSENYYSIFGGVRTGIDLELRLLGKTLDATRHDIKALLIDTSLGLFWLSYLFSRKKLNSF